MSGPEGRPSVQNLPQESQSAAVAPKDFYARRSKGIGPRGDDARFDRECSPDPGPNRFALSRLVQGPIRVTEELEWVQAKLVQVRK